MTKKEIKSARTDIQRMIRKSQRELTKRIKSKHPQLIRAMKRRWDVNQCDWIDYYYYYDLEKLLERSCFL